MKQTIFTILGLLDEYSGRKIAKCKDEVERFYPSEKKIKVVDSGHICFHSQELNDLICSYYVKNNLTDLDSSEIPKYEDDKGYLHYANGRIGESVFPEKNHSWRLSADERKSRLAFLIEAYARYGKENCFCFGNAYHKARLVEELLVQLRTPWLRFTRNFEGVPTLHEIEFKMTDEMKQHFISYRKES